MNRSIHASALARPSIGALVLLTLLTLVSTATVRGQEVDSIPTGWQTSLVFDLTATQTAYSDSWVGGEAGSASWVANLNGKAERQLSPRFNYRSILRMSYGQTMTQDAETGDWAKPRKSTDLIDWENLGRFTMNGFADPYIAFRLETQFQDASVPARKRYLNPMLLTESAGLAKMLYERENRTVLSRLGFALRQTISRDIIDTLLNTETNTATDGGLESVTDVSWKVNDQLTYTGKLTLYKALFYSKEDDVAGTEFADDWKAVDVNWENIVNAQVAKIVAVNFYTQFLYDKQVSRKGRWKQTLGLGVTFTLL